MKKTTLIILGVTTLLIILGIWAYLFMFGAPKSTDEVFSKFGGGENIVTPGGSDQGTVDVGDTTLTGTPQRLKQLTTRPVAGAVSTQNVVTYVEQGTGHMYAIDLGSGVETLISGTTIPGAREAVFSPRGTYVAITTYADDGTHTLAGNVPTQGTGAFGGVSLPLNAHEIAFGTATGTLSYLLKTENGALGNTYNIETEKSVQLFSIPLRDVHVVWGTPTYIYTTPTAYQDGYLYQVKGGALVPTALPGGKSLMATAYGNGVIGSLVENDAFYSFALTHTGEVLSMPLSYIPEKCVESPADVDTLFCATPTDSTAKDFPDAWYKGTVSYTDLIWSIDAGVSEATALIDLLKESGREIDIKDMGVDQSGTKLHFINKNDNTLWMFDTTL